MEQTLRVGVITSTHGIRGEVKVFPTTDDPKRFDYLEEVIVDMKREPVKLEIEGVKYFKQFVILKFKGYDNINDIQQFVKKDLLVTRENAVELEEDCYFLADLRECTVFDTTGKELGRIYDVIQTKNNDVYWIRKPKELLIPVLKDIVLDINIDERKIIIRPVGEWMDED